MFGALTGKKKTFLDPDLEAWVFETYAWLMRNLGGMVMLRTDHGIALPNRDFIPPTEAKGHELALYIFDHVKAHMGMSEWVCELVPVERPPENARVGEFWTIQNVGGGAGGTFHVEDGKVVVSYAADLVTQPAKLIPILAHELSHYLIHGVEEEIPGGEEAHELATELCVAYTGFGVFAINAAFEFNQHGDAFSQGWRSQRSGYLSERTWALALAIDLALVEEAGTVERWLKPSVRDMVAKAERYLFDHPELLEPLRAID